MTDNQFSCRESIQVNPWHILTLMLLIALGALERLYGIDRESLWSDELFAVMASYAPSFRDIWPLLTNDSHPPGYVSFMYWSIPWTGYSDTGIRFHAVVFGTLWIPLVYLIGRRWISSTSGLIAAALVASSQCAIFYSQEARAYSMLVAFCLINIFCYLEILLASPTTKRYKIGFILSSVVTLYLHYTGFILLASQGLFVLIFWVIQQRRSSISELLLLFGIPLLAFSPWLTHMYSHMSDATRNWAVTAAPTRADILNAFANLFGSNTTISRTDQHSLLTWFYAGSLSLAIFIMVRDSFRKSVTFQRKCLPFILLLLGLLPVAAYFIYSHIAIPIFQYRYMLHVLPLGALLSAGLYERLLLTPLPLRWRGIGLALFLLIMSIALIGNNIKAELYSQKSKDPARDAAQWIRQDAASIDSSAYTVLIAHDWLEHYLIQYRISFDKNLDGRTIYLSRQLPSVDDYLAKHPDIKYIYHIGLKNSQTEALIFGLKIRYLLLQKIPFTSNFGGIVVSKFSVYDKPLSIDENSADDSDDSSESRLNTIARWTAEKIQGKDPETFTLLMTTPVLAPYLHYHRAEYLQTDNENLYYAEHQISEVLEHLKQHPRSQKIIYLANQSNSALTRAALELHFPLVESKTFETYSGNIDLLVFDIRQSAQKVSQATQEMLLQSPLNKVVARLAHQVHRSDKPSVILMSHPFFETYFSFNTLSSDPQWDNRFYNGYPGQADAVKQYLDAHKNITQLYYIALKGTYTADAVADLAKLYSIHCQNTFALAPLGDVAMYVFDKQKSVSSASPLSAPTCATP